MNPIMITNAQFYFALSVPLVGILVNVVLITMLSGRIDRLESRVDRLDDRLHTGYDLLIGKLGEFDARLARLEERLSR
jgi:hypothetical protein